jgi:hypothetical protein
MAVDRMRAQPRALIQVSPFTAGPEASMKRWRAPASNFSHPTARSTAGSPAPTRHAAERIHGDAGFGGHVEEQEEIGQAFSGRPAVCRADVGRGGSGDLPHDAPRPRKVRRRPSGMDGDRNRNRGAAGYVGKVALLMQY